MSCSETEKKSPSTISTIAESEIINSNSKEEKEKKVIEFPKYDTVIEMLKSANDYKEEQGCLSLLSKKGETPHIQVSNWVFEGDGKDLMTEQVKRDIIYVSFQAFAETEINKIKVTSIPLKMKDFKNREGYLKKYKKTKSINREKAKSILEKYLNTQNFQDLYELKDGEIWLPNKNFSKLKFQELNKVFADL